MAAASPLNVISARKRLRGHPPKATTPARLDKIGEAATSDAHFEMDDIARFGGAREF